MIKIRMLTLAAVLTGLLVLPMWAAYADDGSTAGIVVTPQGQFDSLADAISAAQDGDVINVYGGEYPGPIDVNKQITLVGHDMPVLNGNDKGTVVRIGAPNVILNGFLIKNSGDVLDQENTGIAVEAPNATVENNRFEDTLFGIYLRKAHGTVIRNNVIRSKDLALPRRGDPIRVWYSNDVLIQDNDVTRGRDVVLWYSERLMVRNNKISEGRYGLHFMYCDDATIEANSLTKNSVGAFLMYSRRLDLHNNFIAQNRGPSGFGVGMKDMDDAVIKENIFMDNRIGASVDNSPREFDSTLQFRDNVFSYNDMGVKLMPSVRRNHFVGNSFKDNQEQVSVGGSGTLKDNLWSVDGVGNYWSDYAGFDADNDGVGDIPYVSDKLFEDLMGRNPSLRLFLYSPAAQSVDFAARALPMVRPQAKMTDSSPLMQITIPEGLPSPPEPSPGAIGLASVGMLASVGGLLMLPRVSFGAMTRTRSEVDATVPQVQTTNLTKRYGKTLAIDGLNFTVQPGEAVALWGSNGAGKTTVIRSILGLLSYEGTVELGGIDIGKSGKEARRLVGFVPQELNLHEDLSVSDTMRFYARLKKAPDGRIPGLLDRMGLTEHKGKRVSQLSGGMKQRLALALALLSDPSLLILDEPTASLDARSRTAFLKLVSELNGEGKTLIFASHRIGDVLSLANRVLVLEGGRLVTECKPEELGKNIGEAATLRIYIAAEDMQRASDELIDMGFEVNMNGSAVLVQVPIGEKAGPISVLTRAGIPVNDFEVEPLVLGETPWTGL